MRELSRLMVMMINSRPPEPTPGFELPIVQQQKEVASTPPERQTLAPRNLNTLLDGANLLPETRKPLGVLAEGLVFEE